MFYNVIIIIIIITIGYFLRKWMSFDMIILHDSHNIWRIILTGLHNLSSEMFDFL